MASSKAEREAIAAAKSGEAKAGETGGEPEVQTQAVQRPDMKKTSAGAKVTVACNLPHGLRLRVFKMIPTRELVMGGGSRDINIAEPIEEALVAGTATEIGKLSSAPIVGGYALTSGISKDLWDAWLKDNQHSAMVKNKCVTAYESASKAEDWAKEHKDVSTGLQPLELENDPRRPRPSSNLVGGITTANDAL